MRQKAYDGYMSFRGFSHLLSDDSGRHSDRISSAGADKCSRDFVQLELQIASLGLPSFGCIDSINILSPQHL